MQKLIAKYGTAAHLAILAVAPLFLFPYVGDGTIAIVMFWLALPAAVWLLMEPSLHGSEHLHDARRRVVRQTMRDPLFWVLIALVILSGFRAFNTGIALAYDSEKTAWHVSTAACPIMPGAVDDAGMLPFAALVALLVILQGCRHSLGRSARMAFLLISSALAGLAAVIAIVTTYYGGQTACELMTAAADSCNYVGFSFGVYLFAGTVALVAAFERHWNFAMLLFVFSIGGTAAGLFTFSPIYMTSAMLVAEVLVLAYSFGYSVKALNASGEFKFLVIGGISFTLGGLLVAALLPEDLVMGRIMSVKDLLLLPNDFWEKRAALSAIAFKSWLTHLWIGTGLSSFSLDFRFNAQPSDWTLFPRGAKMMTHGWWQMLAERGIVGTTVFALPFGFLFFTFVRRLVRSFSSWSFPHPACLLTPIVMAVVIADGFFDCSMMRVEAVVAACAFVAVSAASFRRGGK